jgi:hypothetical protein
VTLGGYVILPRMLDKGRATIAGVNGEFHYDCPLDKQFTSFVGIDSDKLKAELAAGKSDGEILAWIQENANQKLSPWEIQVWSAWQSQRGPGDPDSRSFFNDYHQKLAAHRTDVTSWFDILDLDDYASYGGRP